MERSKMERSNKPSAIPVSPAAPQPIVSIEEKTVTARLHTGESVTIYLHGATVTSWKLSNGEEQLFLSDKAKLDGSKPIRGGVPIVFPVFGPPPASHATSSLPQNGFARSSTWSYLGKTSSESFGTSDRVHSDDSIKLDFGLSTSLLPSETKKAWPYDFGLVYSVTLSPGSLETSLHVQNKGDKLFEFQALFHTYLTVKDISKTTITGLSSKPYIDKTRGAKSFTEHPSTPLSITAETDRVYSSLDPTSPITVLDSNRPRLSITREGMSDATVWNPWSEKTAGMADFGPKDGWKRVLCVEPGAVSGWVKLEAGDAWEGGCLMTAGGGGGS